MSKPILYGPTGAPFTTKVRGALALKKVDYDFREPESPEDYKRLSPTGLLPALHLEDRVVPDSAAILDLLDERYPEPPLVSSDAKVASSQRRLEAWAEATFTFYWRSFLRDLVEREAGSSSRRGAVRRLLRGEENSGMRAEFAGRLDDLVNFLGTRSFYYADRIGRADLAVYALLRRLPEAAPLMSSEMAERPALASHLDRVEGEIGSALA